MCGGIGDPELVEVCVCLIWYGVWTLGLYKKKQSKFWFRCVIFIRGFVPTVFVLFVYGGIGHLGLGI